MSNLPVPRHVKATVDLILKQVRYYLDEEYRPRLDRGVGTVPPQSVSGSEHNHPTLAALVHASRHSSGGADVVTPAAIGASATSHTHGPSAPAVHAASHASGGADVITPAAIGASGTDHTHSPSAPAVHAATHTAGGSDAITVADSQLSSNIPLKSTSNSFAGDQLISKAAGNTYHILQSAAATLRGTLVYSGATLRWFYGVTSGAETGANAGASFEMIRYNDAGAALGVPLAILRSTGAATFENTVQATAFVVGVNQVVGPRGAAVAAGVNSVAAPTKAEFDALVAVVNDLRARLTAHGLIA